jgi:hypothetical protein
MAAEQLLQTANPTYHVQLELSFLQVYGKYVTDLLDDASNLEHLDVRKDAQSGEVDVPGLSRRGFETIEGMLLCVYMSSFIKKNCRSRCVCLHVKA